jgi:hypothetical protein
MLADRWRRRIGFPSSAQLLKAGKASRLHQHSSSKLATHSGLASATPAVNRAAFFISYRGSGLVTHRLARCQPIARRRANVAQISSPHKPAFLSSLLARNSPRLPSQASRDCYPCQTPSRSDRAVPSRLRRSSPRKQPGFAWDAKNQPLERPAPFSCSPILLGLPLGSSMADCAWPGSCANGLFGYLDRSILINRCSDSFMQGVQKIIHGHRVRPELLNPD